MVAEFADIATATAEQKTTSSTAIGRPRPKWIQTATREPKYRILDTACYRAEVSSESSFCRTLTDNIVVISASNSEKAQKLQPVITTIPPYELEVTDDHAIYSVVVKKRRQKVEESQFKVHDSQRQQEPNKWLQSISHCRHNQQQLRGESNTELENTSRQHNSMFIPDYTERFDEDDWSRDRESVQQVRNPPTREVVGLVGPYRVVYSNPNERREFMLREEELVEEIVDSISEIAAAKEDADRNLSEPHQRAKWRIREDDEETLVPDDLFCKDTKEPESAPSLIAENRKNCTLEDLETLPNYCCWNRETEGTGTTPASENGKFGENDPKSRITAIISNIEERAVDVPDRPPSYPATTLMDRETGRNELQDKDSLNDAGSTTGGTVTGAPKSNPAGCSGGERNANNSLPTRSLVARILARARSPDDSQLDHSEPFSQLWVVLSNVYGELVVILMLALCLAEVMDTPVPLLSLQSVFLMFLYVGSIAVIISIYLWLLVDSCSSMGNSTTGLQDDAETGGASLTRFGSLKKAHISRTRTAPTSFYIRVGALLFGLATLVFNGLEMAMHSMMQGAECLSDVVFVHPVLHGLFTFLQMHFLFVNSQVLVERFGLAARFGFTHLAATNIAVWARLVIWDSAQEWTYFVHLAQRGPQSTNAPLTLRGFPESLTRHRRDLLGETLSAGGSPSVSYQPISDEQISQVVALQECLNANTLGQLWSSSMPFLYPFIVQFSLIAAAVTFVMGQNVARTSRLSHSKRSGLSCSNESTSHTRLGCGGSSKGLFLGILCTVAGIVVILIFLVVREAEHFPPATLSWLTCGTLIGILTLSGLMTMSGLVQVRRMSVVDVTDAPTASLDSLLSTVALFGVQLYSLFTIVVSACSLATMATAADEPGGDTVGRHVMLLSVSVLQLVQCFAQSTLIAEASRRRCITRLQMIAKPARQVITFLLFSNAVLWAFDTVVTQSWLSQELQLRFFGVLAWGVISRISLPLLVFYRFHSCVLLLEIWNKCYRMPRGEHLLN